MFNRTDRNSDGAITAEEMEASRRRWLASLFNSRTGGTVFDREAKAQLVDMLFGLFHYAASMLEGT